MAIEVTFHVTKDCDTYNRGSSNFDGCASLFCGRVPQRDVGTLYKLSMPSDNWRNICNCRILFRL
jgi:hypothetical protein